MPRASSRSSSSARVSSSWAAPTIAAAFSGALAIWFWAIRSVRLSATSRCWAPSCRLRSSRRRSARPASTIRLRERRSAASRRSPRIARPAAAATERERPRARRAGCVVDDRADALALELDRRPGAPAVAVGGQRRRAAVAVDPASSSTQYRSCSERSPSASASRPRRPSVPGASPSRTSSSPTASARATWPRSRPTRNVNGIEAKTTWPASGSTPGHLVAGDGLRAERQPRRAPSARRPTTAAAPACGAAVAVAARQRRVSTCTIATASVSAATRRQRRRRSGRSWCPT